jgi:CelD/BcsL family acetyltransferase involved in cellulose biosynthesis
MSRAKIRVVTELAELERLAKVWDDLREKSGDESSMYLTHEWLSTRWKYFGEGKKLNILLIERDRQVIGIIPLIRNEYRVGPLKIEALESITWTSSNYVGLMSPENREEVISTLLSYLKENLARNKLILRLSLIPEESQFLSALRRNMASLSPALTFQERVRTLAPYIILPTSWDGYFNSLGWRRRRNIKGALRDLAKKQSTVEFKRCTADGLEEVLDKFSELHQERWRSAGLLSGFTDPREKEFYKEVSRKLLKRKWLYFSYMTIDNKIVSAVFGCVYNRKFYFIATARDIKYARYSVGHLHEMHLIKGAINQKLREFDFLQGDEPYKFYWAKSVRRYMQVIITKGGFLPRLRLKLLRAFLRLCDIRRYSLKELYSIYLIRRRERKEHKRMGLLEGLERLKMGQGVPPLS